MTSMAAAGGLRPPPDLRGGPRIRAAPQGSQEVKRERTLVATTQGRVTKTVVSKKRDRILVVGTSGMSSSERSPVASRERTL